MSRRTYINLNLVLAAAIIVALALIPRTADVSDTQFLLICGGTFAGFCVLSLGAKMEFGKALLRAAMCSFVTLITAAAIAAIIHEIVLRP